MPFSVEVASVQTRPPPCANEGRSRRDASAALQGEVAAGWRRARADLPRPAREGRSCTVREVTRLPGRGSESPAGSAAPSSESLSRDSCGKVFVCRFLW